MKLEAFSEMVNTYEDNPKGWLRQAIRNGSNCGNRCEFLVKKLDNLGKRELQQLMMIVFEHMVQNYDKNDRVYIDSGEWPGFFSSARQGGGRRRRRKRGGELFAGGEDCDNDDDCEDGEKCNNGDCEDQEGGRRRRKRGGVGVGERCGTNEDCDEGLQCELQRLLSGPQVDNNQRGICQESTGGRRCRRKRTRKRKKSKRRRRKRKRTKKKRRRRRRK